MRRWCPTAELSAVGVGSGRNGRRVDLNFDVGNVETFWSIIFIETF